MADNFPLTPGSGRNAATDQVTYSGDTADVQLVRPVLTTGSEGSRTVVDLTGDASNGLDVDVTRLPWSVVSTANSSTATLTSGSIFTGTSEEVKDYGAIQVSVIASHASATDGLSVQQSSDGTNWDITDTFTVPAATGKTYSFQTAARYFRLVYTNGGTGQSSFRLQTVFHYHAPKPSSQRPADAYSNENDFQQVWSFNSNWNGSTWDRAAGNTSGAYSQGNIAHDGIDAGNPVLNGYRAIAHGTNPTAVAAADRTVAYANRAGVPFVIGGHPNVVSYGMSITTAVSNTVVGPTVASGLKLVVTSISFLLDNASTVFPSVVVGFGTANTPAFATTPGTAKIVAGHPACPAGGGMSKGDGSGMIGVGADDEELRITTVGTAGGNGLYVLMTGYTIES